MVEGMEHGENNPYESSSFSYCLLLVSGFNCLVVHYLLYFSSKKTFTGVKLSRGGSCECET